MTPHRTFPYAGAAFLLLVAAIGLFLGSAQASGQAVSPSPGLAPPAIPSPPANGSFVDTACAECHGDTAIKAKGEGFYVPASELAASMHKDLACIDCHLETSGVLHKNPTAERAAAAASCGGCHEDQQAAWAASSHAKAPAGKGPTCVTCHGNHDAQAADNRTFISDSAALCSSCHTERGSNFSDHNYHGKETSLGRIDVAVCADCHGPHQVLPASDPASSVSEQNVVATCSKCHPGANDNFGDIQIHVDANPIPSDPKLALATVYFIVVLTATFGLFGWHMILGLKHEWRTRRTSVRSDG